jgi:hypothetical protein
MENKIYVVNVEDTIKYGIIKAAIIGRIRFWGEYNKENNVKDKFHDGEWWGGYFTPADLEEQLGIPEKINEPLVMTCSRSHHSGPVLQIINLLKEKGHELDYIKKGSALKFFDLATGRADIYPRFAPTMEWDIAAGQAILEALGGEVVHAETGKPLCYNKANLVNPYFIARTQAMKNSKR